jgi:exodeoxyribonuclease VII large subunit
MQQLALDLEKASVLTVSQLTHAIKLHLESTFPSLWLQGEVSNCKMQSSGHLYFSLKDAKAQIAAVMFRGDISPKFPLPKDGDHLIVRGDLNVYPPSGRYQLVIREMRHVGLGDLLLKLEELKEKLKKQGWFRTEHKKPLPKFPRCIGVVTSPTGAVIQDILHILTRRFSGFHLILNPVRVQGEGAAQEIAKAIQQFNQWQLADVLIVGRGGGSLEDLWAFNEEIVAEAIFHSTIPIISAVGHETDHSIADYVADVRAPTPSAAAELAIADRGQCLLHLAQMQRRLYQTTGHLVRQYTQRLSGIRRHPVFSSPYALLGPSWQKLDAYRQNLEDTFQRTLKERRALLASKQQQLQALRPHAQIAYLKRLVEQKREKLDYIWRTKMERWKQRFDKTLKNKQLEIAWDRLTRRYKERLGHLIQSIGVINPKNLLSKGYCILFAEKDNSVITSVKNVAIGEDVKFLLADGSLDATINNVNFRG